MQGFSYVLAAMAQVRSLRLSGVSASAKSIAPATDPLETSNAYDPVVVCILTEAHHCVVGQGDNLRRTLRESQ